MSQSKTNIAYEVVKDEKNGLSFANLWKEVCKIANIAEEDADSLISSFYTDLSLDGRFITLGDNVWDLREKHSFDMVHIDMNDIYSDEEDIIEAEEGIIAKEDTEENLFQEHPDQD